MKKAISIVLTLVMALSLCTVAFAGEKRLGSESEVAVIPVTIKSVADGDAGTIFAVDVVWGAMQFDYATGNYTKWNPNTHEVDSTAGNAWLSTGNDIKVTNHSNAAVNVTIAVDGGNTKVYDAETVNVKITSDSQGNNLFTGAELANAYLVSEGRPQDAPSTTAYVHLSGAYTGNTEQTFNIQVSFAEA